jgi:hypothetical protein
MRYLLDELTTYEEGFGDMLMDDRAPERHETFMGDQDLSITVSRADLRKFEHDLIQKFREAINSQNSGISASSSLAMVALGMSDALLKNTPKF